MSKPVLYTYFRSSSAYRVRIVLHYKQIEFEPCPVHLLKGDQQSIKYVQKNPMGQVPFFQHGSLNLSQSMAIIEYIDEAFAGPKVFPKELSSRSVIRQMCEIINSGIQPLQNLSVMKRLSEQLGASQSQVKDWNRYWIAKGLGAMEMLIKAYGDSYAFGDKVTAADAFLIPQVYNAQRFDVDISAFQHICQVVESCQRLTAFQKAHPDNQKQ